MKKKYSVLMSVYSKDKKDFLKLSLNSMLNQTVKPDQVVLVKDGQLPEELNNLITEYLSSNPNVFTVVELSNNVGLGEALNEGLKYCRHELVARMDSDDISFLNRCEKQLAVFESCPELGIVGGHTSEFYDDINNIISYRVVPTRYLDILKFSKTRSPFNHPSVMYKKSEVLSVNGYPPLKRKQDLGLFINMLANGTKAVNIDEPIIYYRSDKDNYKRRKTWGNCKTYIQVIYKSWRKGHSSVADFLFVLIGQLGMFLAPMWLLKYISDNMLRK